MTMVTDPRCIMKGRDALMRSPRTAFQHAVKPYFKEFFKVVEENNEHVTLQEDPLITRFSKEKEVNKFSGETPEELFQHFRDLLKDDVASIVFELIDKEKVLCEMAMTASRNISEYSYGKVMDSYLDGKVQLNSETLDKIKHECFIFNTRMDRKEF